MSVCASRSLSYLSVVSIWYLPSYLVIILCRMPETASGSDADAWMKAAAHSAIAMRYRLETERVRDELFVAEMMRPL